MSAESTSIDEIFSNAIEIDSPDERDRFVELRCGRDPAMHARLKKLLDAHDRAGGFLESAAPRVAALAQRVAADVAIGSQVDSYTIIKQLGEGGIGTVYLAEQTHPLRRSVALKIIKLGMDTRQVIARFEAERQALALMDHPHIARVIDAGSTAMGRPYFVMELVDGIPISDYSDQHQLNIEARLMLFTQICHAVQHAHQKGLIHRDIKPSNVLVGTVDAQPVAKVIDFGVAKAVGANLIDQTLVTEVRQLIGTLEYMSPEQAEGSLDIDTRTDVYSLGVLLYELLTGTTPFEGHKLRSSAFADIQRIIRETDPPKPSTRLSKLQSAPTSRAVVTSVRGELDWIVMKCLEKDRARRYESAAALARDIGHHLADEPIAAAAPSKTYRVRKFIRRHRVGVIASTAVAITLISGIIGTTIAMIGQSRQRREAERLEKIAVAVSNFQGAMFHAASPWKSGENVTVLQVMESAAKQLDDGQLKDEPIAEANVRQMIGDTLESLGRYAESEQSFRKALALRRQVHPERDPYVADVLSDLANVVMQNGRLGEAEKLFRESLEMRQNVLAADNPRIGMSYSDLGAIAMRKGDYAGAASLQRQALAIARRQKSPDRNEIGTYLVRLGWALQYADNYAEAESAAREAIDSYVSVPRAAPADLNEAKNLLAVTFARTGRPQDGEPLFREVLEANRKIFPATHPLVAQALSNLAGNLQQQGKLADAEPLAREGLAQRRKVFPDGGWEVSQSAKNLAMLLQQEGKLEEAESLAREALAMRRKVLPAGHLEIAAAWRALGNVLRDEKRFTEAEAALREAWAIVSKRDASDSRQVGCIQDFHDLYVAWGNVDKAAYWQAQLGQNPPSTAPTSAPAAASD